MSCGRSRGQVNLWFHESLWKAMSSVTYMFVFPKGIRKVAVTILFHCAIENLWEKDLRRHVEISSEVEIQRRHSAVSMIDWGGARQMDVLTTIPHPSSESDPRTGVGGAESLTASPPALSGRPISPLTAHISRFQHNTPLQIGKEPIINCLVAKYCHLQASAFTDTRNR